MYLFYADCHCIFVFSIITAVCFGKTVFQSPGDLIKNKDESAVIICTHNIPNYD